MKRKLRVGVIFGGKSGEHEVSLISARSVMSALDPEKYEIVPIGITRTGRWLTGPHVWQQLQAGGKGEVAKASPEERETLSQSLIPNRQSSVASPPSPIANLDVVFPVLHGPFGEDGTVQGLLELADIPYVGSGVAASAVGMDKAMMKALFRQAGLPILPYLVIKRCDWEQTPQAVISQVESEIGYPCFCKPANLGSSVGISRARDSHELTAALHEAARYDRKLLVEQAAGDIREIEVSILGNDSPIASVPGEIVPHRNFYDYVAKYLDDTTELIIPADLPVEVANQVRQLGVRAFLAVDAAGMARVDFFVRRDLKVIYVNEINTIPGFTSVSMYPKLWEASGIPYSQLLDRLIELALERYADKTRSVTHYTITD